ncbi:GxGYxYP family putative glycoside hydrolase [Chitinophaga sp. CC14]|uniref:GxGYxYP domain-containing protein n=1 Tax=Chitinophaga sp. CC14 TaxID=3029199 RepID=UPI003B78E840
MRNSHTFIFFIATMLAVVTACGKKNTTEVAVVLPPGADTVVLKKGVLHQKGAALTALCAIPASSLTAEQKVLIATLQGVVAKTSGEQIYIDEGGASSVWKNYLSEKYKIRITNYTSWAELLRHFVPKVSGYVLYNRTKNIRSLTAANSLCGPMNAIAVDASLETAVITAGIKIKKADMRARDEKWVWEHYSATFSRSLAAEQNPAIDHHLRDYITLTNAFTFYDGETPWRADVLKALQPEAFCFGYGKEEFSMVANAAAAGVVMLPTDLAANLAPLSSVYDEAPLKQQGRTTPAAEQNVHYVTFLLSDGDNVGYDLWSMQQYFSHPLRGTFNMGYTISPSLVDLAPAAMRWYYEKAANTDKGRDFFVAGPSGSGYTFPSKMPAAALDQYVQRLNTFMAKSDLNIVNILDQGALERMDLWDKYLAQPNIDALLYTGYGEAPGGSIRFSANGKPVIEAGDNLWAGLEEEATVISNINARPADPYSRSGYTLVFVHTWTKDMSAISTVIAGLNKNVRVVTPDAFVQLVRKNLGTK